MYIYIQIHLENRSNPHCNKCTNFDNKKHDFYYNILISFLIPTLQLFILKFKSHMVEFKNTQ